MMGLMCTKQLIKKDHTVLCKCIICHYWYFLETNFRFQWKVCSGCHDLMQKAMSFNDVAIASIKGNDKGTHFLVYEEKWNQK